MSTSVDEPVVKGSPILCDLRQDRKYGHWSHPMRAHMRKCCIHRRSRGSQGHKNSCNMEEVETTVKVNLFSKHYTVAVRCQGVTSRGLIPTVGKGTPHRGKVTMGHHPMEVNLALKLLPTLCLSPGFRVGVFPQGLGSNLRADLLWLLQKRGVSIFCVRILKNHLRRYLFRFYDIYFLLCRDISLAAEVFFLNRSKCQVWLSQQAQPKGLPWISYHE